MKEGCQIYKNLDALSYGKRVSGAGYVYYIVKEKQMTVSEYMDYCIRKELKRVGIK